MYTRLRTYHCVAWQTEDPYNVNLKPTKVPAGPWMVPISVPPLPFRILSATSLSSGLLTSCRNMYTTPSTPSRKHLFAMETDQ
jgi:hypothetical protein